MLLDALPVGLVVGLSLGALGGGGSILTVPALVYVLDQNPHGATTASLLVVGISSLAGALAHRSAGRVRTAQGLVFGLLGAAGSFLGSRISSGLDAHLLLGAFAGLLLVAAAAVALRSARLRHVGREVRLAGAGGPPSPSAGAVTRGTGPAARSDLLARSRLVAAASAVGLLTGFFGVGGGFVVVPALVVALGLEMPVAVGTSLLVIAINSATGLLSRLGTHPDLDLAMIAVFCASAVGGSLLGTRVAGRARPELLGLAFAALLVGVSVYMAWRSAPFLL